jgi:ABC-2 type transport system permease protein
VNITGQRIALYTLIHKQIKRIFRIWVQTLLPGVITTILYYLIFGHIIGSRMGNMHGYPYIQFIAPGLIMMQIITGAYSGSVSSFFSEKFQRSIEELLVSPMSHFLILVGYMSSGVLRALIIGMAVSIVTLFFTHLHVYSVLLIMLSAFLTACIFSLAGLINAAYAKTFDDISIIPTFVLAPLTYLGGVFYSITLLSPFWQKVSYANPIVYMVSTFRYGFLQQTDSHILASYVFMVLLTVALFVWAILLFKNPERLSR